MAVWRRQANMKNGNPANVSTEIHHPLNTNQVLLNH